MAKKNFYVVKKGKIPGIYKTWEECKSQTDGVSGAVYRGFATREEAEAFYGGNFAAGADRQVAMDSEEPAVSSDSPSETVPMSAGTGLSQGEALAYVDGSYNVDTGEYSCGVVFFYEGEESHISKKGEDKELAQMRNVAGEILGAEMAMAEAVRRGVKKLTIVHDYQGIASWCLGEWKTNKEGTKAYKAYYDSLQDTLKIRFQKVKGHSGDIWNDLADELAKSVIF